LAGSTNWELIAIRFWSSVAPGWVVSVPLPKKMLLRASSGALAAPVCRKDAAAAAVDERYYPKKLS